MKREKPRHFICLFSLFFVCSCWLHAQDTTKKAEEPFICAFPQDEMPEFYGGYNAFKEFVVTCTMYPDSAYNNGISGKVFISFIVTENGDVTDVKVLRGIGYGCDEEAMRVIRFTDGNWTPGKSNGKPVKVKFNVPILFKLN